MLLRARAPAKVNLTLHVLGRRADGFHELDSLVAFAGCAADALTLEPGPGLALANVDGPFAGPAGDRDQNLVLKAARAAAERIDGVRLGAFSLTKRIPVAAGLGGGSADAGAALRLIAELNGLALDDPRIVEAAAATGSDVPACLLSRAARMTGRGEELAPLDLAPLAAVLANPMKGLSTADVFRGLGLAPGETADVAGLIPAPRQRGGWPLAKARGREGTSGDGAVGGLEPGPDATPPDLGLVAEATLASTREGLEAAALDEILAGRNDLEPPARALMAEIAIGLDALAASESCHLTRMSGSGATVFGLYDDQRSARRAARALRARLPGWWIRPTLLL